MGQVDRHILILQSQFVEMLHHIPDLLVRTTTLDHVLDQVLGLLREDDGIAIVLDLLDEVSDLGHVSRSHSSQQHKTTTR